MTIKLRKVTPDPSPGGMVNEPAPVQSIPLKPLAISGVCVTKEALVEALKIYLPTIQNIQAVEGESLFLITLGSRNEASETGPVG